MSRSSAPAEVGPLIGVEVRRRAERRRFLAIVLPELLNELACAHALLLERSEPGIEGPVELQRPRSHPSAVVLRESSESVWDASTKLDAVNTAARERGVRPRQTIAEASALVGNLKVLSLERARIRAALRRVADVALAFGSPASFDELDTVWIDISGSTHLFGTERQLATQLAASIRALGHVVRVAVADGPWVAGALARYGDESAVSVLAPSETARAVAALPILALPIAAETVAWFSQLGLLFIEDLRKLPMASLAARLPSGRHVASSTRSSALLESSGASGSGCVASVASSAVASGCAAGIELGSVLDLIHGADDSVLIPYHPEETPFEESSWDEPLNDVEPLLFVCKGLAARLGTRLEARGQAAQKLLLTIQYDRSIAALQSAATGIEIDTSHEVHLELATPLAHAEDIERVVRSRLQREVLSAPATGLSLRATSVTLAQSWQPGLCSAYGLGSDIMPEARNIAVLVAELAADVGTDAVGVLALGDSHLLEKRSRLTPIVSIKSSDASSMHVSVSGSHSSAVHRQPNPQTNGGASLGVSSGCDLDGGGLASLSLPTRLFADPLELAGPIDFGELWVLGQQPFIVKEIRFEERLEAVEWWDNEPIERDYFRVWLTKPPVTSSRAERGYTERYTERGHSSCECIEVLAYHDRESGKSYVQAVYD